MHKYVLFAYLMHYMYLFLKILAINDLFFINYDSKLS